MNEIFIYAILPELVQFGHQSHLIFNGDNPYDSNFFKTKETFTFKLNQLIGCIHPYCSFKFNASALKRANPFFENYTYKFLFSEYGQNIPINLEQISEFSVQMNGNYVSEIFDMSKCEFVAMSIAFNISFHSEPTVHNPNPEKYTVCLDLDGFKNFFPHLNNTDYAVFGKLFQPDVLGNYQTRHNLEEWKFPEKMQQSNYEFPHGTKIYPLKCLLYSTISHLLRRSRDKEVFAKFSLRNIMQIYNGTGSCGNMDHEKIKKLLQEFNTSVQMLNDAVYQAVESETPFRCEFSFLFKPFETSTCACSEMQCQCRPTKDILECCIATIIEELAKLVTENLNQFSLIPSTVFPEGLQKYVNLFRLSISEIVNAVDLKRTLNPNQATYIAMVELFIYLVCNGSHEFTKLKIFKQYGLDSINNQGNMVYLYF
jgi:hypothetical protein